MFFQERIYGNSATVYHRTDIPNLINKVYTEGFKPGTGDYYGKGLYTTYELEEQLKPGMKEKYGDIIVKFIVHNIDKFFIFDYSEFKKSPNYKLLGKPLEYEFLQKQFEHFNINYEKYGFDVEKAIDTIKNRFSSKVAKWCYENIPNFTKLVEGIILTGENDGKVLVSYNPNRNAIPLSYSTDDGKTWNKVPTNLEYLRKIVLHTGQIGVELRPESFGITNYKFDKKNRLNVFQDVDLSYRGLTELPFKFNIVEGNFNISYNKIKNLENAPIEVYGNFNAEVNEITEIPNRINLVYGKLDVSYNRIVSLNYLPVCKKGNEESFTLNLEKNNLKYINPNAFKYNPDTSYFDIFLSYNPNLKDLNGLPEIAYLIFVTGCNNLTTIRTDIRFKEILSDFIVSNCNLYNLKGSPIKVYGTFDVSNNPNLTSLFGCPEYIEYDMDISNTQVSLEYIAAFPKESIPKVVKKGIKIDNTVLRNEIGNIKNVITVDELKKYVKNYT